MAYPDDFSSLAGGFLNTTPAATAGTETRAEAGTHAAHHNALAGSVNLLEETVGLRPAGVHRNVAARLGVIDLGTDWSAGDRVNFYATNGGAGVPGQRIEIRHGAAGTAVTLIGPSVKVSRTGAVTRSAIESAGTVGTDGSDQLAAIMGISLGTAAEEVQGIGVAGFAKTSSQAGSPGNDACGGYFVGRAMSDSDNSLGIGLVAVGRRDVSPGKITGIEVQAMNNTANEGPLNVTGPSTTKGLWVNADGGAPVGVAFQIGNPFDQQFLYGIHANGQVRSTVGGIRDGFIRDDSTAHKSIWIRGTHDQGAVIVEDGAGPVVIGAAAPTVDTSQLLELHAGGITRNPIFRLTAGAAGVNLTQKFNNPTGSFYVGQVGGVNSLMTGTAIGDGVLYVDGARHVHIGRSGGRAPLRVGDNVAIGSGAANSTADMIGGVFLADAVTSPTTNPTGGGLLYGVSGALLWRDPSGLVTKLSGDQSHRYTVSNHSAQRALDEASVSVTTVANVLGTLIGDLQSTGQIG